MKKLPPKCAAPHNLAVRLYNGKVKIDKLTTIKGKDYQLLNLPYYLSTHIGKYLDWMIAAATASG
ncbi:hypothetical protein [Chitinophaga sp. XS-30]|uniref:hypothetical protein n=1 Tax=Chitinophaga sp. XS-30 TaxID=2604421 RepID=UPI0011DE10F1|nr:hypothetical protein [Chitinophaga sp. XS-30]QEH41331.1 hypothetical protein FW415_10765 [Chitinophaga sp. XS-30]